MKNTFLMNGKSSLLLISAIVILCTGFFILSCGNDSQRKTQDTDRGAFAIDFSQCPGTLCHVFAAGDRINPAPDVSDTELTVEAWVQSKATDGGIFSRMDPSRGITLYVKNDEPKFGMRVQTAMTSTPGSPTPTAEYVVGSGFTLMKDAWTHIAGVIAAEDHSSVHPAVTCLKGDGNAGGETEIPHLDIYVNGDIKNCGTTWGFQGDPVAQIPPDPATGPQFADNPAGPNLALADVLSGPIDGVGGTISAVIDEARLWLTGKTENQIQECMNTELGVGGICNRGDPDLAVYYRLNEGEHANATDFSGNGLSGGVFKFTPDEEEWEDGWVPGNPNLQRAD